ncbi:nucleoside diphosphate kinase homolog 7 isoform X2 [Ambystoma mexicanum]|uniref:nucleoside diphosphate kinase homolog 7 isoform X2 n=1 Tax=Ambystoma mexicanum TaxID=8296 RepID=UPI0037E78EFF
MSDEDRCAFVAEWYDPNAALLRRYQLLYYTKDGSVEMFDMKSNRVFLKRTKYEDLHVEDLFVGNKINVFSRQLQLIEYADQYTARKLGSKKEKTLAVIKPDAFAKMGAIIELILSADLTITKMKMVLLTRKEAVDFYLEHQTKTFFNDLINFMISGPVIAMELLGDEAVCAWRRLMGPTNSATARSEEPNSLRAKFGTDGTKNATHGSDSVASAARELEFFFPTSGGRGPSNTAKYSDCTCCIIKPHAVSAKCTGTIIREIMDAGFEISALQMFKIEIANAEEFYEVYKGVVAEYSDMLVELCAGPCIAMEIRGEDAPKRFREFCGPSDPEIARHLRPKTLRARYGKSKVRNAVHCSDLPEDGLLEVQYFFKILEN